MSTSHVRDPRSGLETPQDHQIDSHSSSTAPGTTRSPAGPAMFLDRPDTSMTSTPLAHGPGGVARRGALALVLAVVVVAVVSAAWVGIGRVAPTALAPLAVADLAFVGVAVATGITRAIVHPWNAVRSPLLTGQIMLVALALLWAAGITVPSLRGIVEVEVLSSAVLAGLRWILSSFYRPRTVLISSTDGLLSSAAKNAKAVLGITDPGSASPQELVSATAAAVDEVHADVVRVDGSLPDEMLAHLSWGLRSRKIPLQMDLLEGSVSPSRIVATGRDGASVLVAAPNPSLGTRFLKRSMDVLGSALLILALSPLLIGTALAIKLDDRGPIIFRQIRIGRNGKEFGIYKFRTMAVDADARLQELLRKQNTEGKPLFKVQNDPRLTRIGGFLRRYSIDELPQLFNVLFGTMSLVGPRPQREAEVALYTGTASHRLGVSPGMTGLWQVSGRSNLSWDEAQRLDVHYAHNWSVGMDISILLRTVKAVVGKDGAY